MARYLFETLAAACALSMASTSICCVSNGADAGAGGGGKATKAKAEPKPAAAAKATAPDTITGGDGNDTLTAAEDPPAVDETPSLADPASLGFAKIRHPEGATSVSFEGQTYEAGKDGAITVPLLAVGPLTAHGFVLVD